MADNRFCIHDLDWLKLRESRTYELHIVGVSSLPAYLIACVPAEHVVNFNNDDDKVQRLGASVYGAMAYKPSVDEVCLSMLGSGTWCRTFLLKYDGDDALVYCFDYGTQCRVRSTNIRVLQQPLVIYAFQLKEIFYSCLQKFSSEIAHMVRTIVFHVDGVDDYRQKLDLFANRSSFLAHVDYNQWSNVHTIKQLC